MFNYSLSEWLLVAIIFLMVVAAPRVGRLGEIIASAFGPREPEGRDEGPSEPGATP